ncbi:hypothetical protein FGM00_11310 [Aggregatimonas sangjinii]|uniref:Uncharacterized protein n=1 Tax=Aggregatimonas sangjinii TaxID=2583587 RepID=A0A5B7SPQ7_9FLAO|nr:hypothetical protein [Aggregatimonas sangjinii]QCX00665.1 hypothetical protein FGM00_11310 [Aggregatimonas sangjinii]
MKHLRKIIIMCFALCWGMGSSAQTISTKDEKNRRILGKQAAQLMLRTLITKAMKKDLKDASNDLENDLEKQYGPNNYDLKADFIAKAGLKSVMAIGVPKFLDKFKNLPYMPQSKKDYISGSSYNTATDLAFLTFLSNENVKASDRQKIYRIRREILRTYSKDEKNVRKILFLCAIGYIVLENDTSPAELLTQLEILL